MNPNDKHSKLVKIYCYVCEKFEEGLWFECERFSNNKEPKLSDEEILAIYLYVMYYQEYFKIKQIHRFAMDYLLDWFPNLGTYQAFNNRLNRLSGVLDKLSGAIIKEFHPQDCSKSQSLLDSMPIITCSGKRAGKVAREITDKGYCSTKSMYYYGMKLHALGFRRQGKMPYPEEIMFTPASVNDLSLFKEQWSTMENRIFIGDKIYNNKEFFEAIEDHYNSHMLTPVKGVKGMSQFLKNFDRAANDLYSRAVSKVRQPIESLFNWLIEKSDIQDAHRARSTKGLTVHAYGRLAAAFITLIF